MSQEIKMIGSQEEFKKMIEHGVVLVDFWAPWCGPCRMQLPILDSLAKTMADKATIAKVNVDEQQELALEYKVESIPTLFLFKDGNIVQQFVGVQSEATLSQALQTA